MTRLRSYLAAALLAAGALLAAPAAHADGEGILVITQSTMAAGEVSRHQSPAEKAEMAQQAARELEAMKIAFIDTLFLVFAGIAGNVFLQFRSSKRARERRRLDRMSE